MKDCSQSITLTVKGNKFNLNRCFKDEFKKEQMQNISYALAIGSLMYAQVCTKLGIAFTIEMLGRY